MADGISFTTIVKLNRIPEIISGMSAKAEMVVAKAALDIEGNAKASAPVDTGFLRGSIQARKIGAMHWEITVGADYGIYLEYGTRFMPAQPYFHPAITKVRPVFLAAMKRIISI